MVQMLSVLPRTYASYETRVAARSSNLLITFFFARFTRYK